MTEKTAKIIRETAELLVARRNAAALTGAGISVESGIPAFRGAQGMWERYDPMEYATIGAFLQDPKKVWRMLAEMMGVLVKASPNPAHTALADMERDGLLRAVITQNIDGLHQAAGSRTVVEYHGNPGELVCLSCGRKYPSLQKIAAGGIPPRCGCGAILKPDVVFFGEAIPSGPQEEAEDLASACKVFLVVGTSAQVAPACDLPKLAKKGGAAIVEINPERTILTETATDLYIGEGAGTALPAIAAAARELIRPAVKRVDGRPPS